MAAMSWLSKALFQWGRVSEDAEGASYWPNRCAISGVFQWGRVSEDAEGQRPHDDTQANSLFQWGRVSEDAEGRVAIDCGYVA